MRRGTAEWAGIGVTMAATAIALATTCPVVATAAARGTTTRPASCGGERYEPQPPDFNHDGASDFIIGLPNAHNGAGAIEVVEHGAKPVIFSPGTHGIPAMPAGSHFGARTTVFDANGDGCSDLLISVPDLDVSGRVGAGGLYVMLGSPHGLTAAALVTQNLTNVPGAVARNAHFGTAVFADLYNGPNVQGPSPVGTLLNVGVPGATVTDSVGTPQPQAGQVVSFDLSPHGIPVQANPYPPQTMSDPTQGAHFGSDVGEDFVTAPDATTGQKKHAGCIQIWNSEFFGRTSGARLGTTVALSGASNTADKLYGLVVGAPGQRVDGHDRAGAVEQFNVEYDGPAVDYLGETTQASPGVPGAPQRGAQFGAAISVGYVTSGPHFVAQIAIGAPHATVDGVRDAGRVDVNSRELEDSVNGFVGRGWTTQTQVTAHGKPAPGTQAGFGSSLTEFLPAATQSSSSQRLLIGIPGAPVDQRRAAGRAEIVPLGLHGLTKRWVHLLTETGGAHARDGFGTWVDGTGPGQDDVG